MYFLTKNVDRNYWYWHNKQHHLHLLEYYFNYVLVLDCDLFMASVKAFSLGPNNWNMFLSIFQRRWQSRKVLSSLGPRDTLSNSYIYVTNSENNLNTGIAGLLHLILERMPHRKEKGGREEMKCGWEPNPHGDVRRSDPTPGTPGTRDY